MDWGTVVAAFVGAALPSSGTLLTLRADRRQRLEARQWLDADVVADVQQFLNDIDPMRRAVDLNPAEGAADEMWKNLDQRRDQVQRKLLLLAAGHPQKLVRDRAARLARLAYNAEVKLKLAYQHPRLGLDRDGDDYMMKAMREQNRASVEALNLANYVQYAGEGRMRRRWLPWWLTQPWQIRQELRTRRLWVGIKKVQEAEDRELGT